MSGHRDTDKDYGGAKPPLLKIQDAASYLGISVSTMKRLTELPYVKIGKCKRWRIADLDKYIASNMRGEQPA